MTRYKEYIRDHGYDLESDYPTMPWQFANCKLLDVRTEVREDCVALVEVCDVLTVETLFTPSGVVHVK